MEEAIGAIVGVCAAIAAAIFALGYILGSLYWLLVNAGFLTLALLDWSFSASLLPKAPEVVWGCWGALAGAVCGFWTIAPVYGLRARNFLLWLVPLALLITAATRTLR